MPQTLWLLINNPRPNIILSVLVKIGKLVDTYINLVIYTYVTCVCLLASLEAKGMIKIIIEYDM